MSDDEGMGDERPTIMIPDLCERHVRDLVVYKLAMMPDQPWRSRIIVAQILLFQLTTNEDRFWQQIGGDDKNVTKLPELGCLACWSEDNYQRAARILRRGFEHAAEVSQGKASDPDFPVELSGGVA